MKTTTKIVGAVVGVLLVAALFTGAAAADPAAGNDNALNLGDVYVWELKDGTVNISATYWLTDIFAGTTWTNNADETVTFTYDPVATKYYIDGKDVVDGVYYHTAEKTKELCMINVKHLAAPTGYIVEYNSTAATLVPIASLDGARVDISKFHIRFVDAAGTSIPEAGDKLAWINPSETLLTTTPTALGIPYDGTLNGFYNIYNADELGVYTVAAAATNDGTTYTSFAPSIVTGKPITFELYNSDNSMSLTALADEVLQGNYVTVSLEAPRGTYTATLTNGSIPTGQPNVSGTTITVGLDGITTFKVKALNKDDIKITVTGNSLTKSITIKVVPGKISAEAVPAITNIGNEIDIIGTDETGGPLTLFMKGENYFKEIVTGTHAVEATKAYALDKPIKGKEFTVTLKTGAEYLGADAGYYTLYLAKLEGTPTINGPDDFANSTKCSAYTTVAIKLVPSFISITEMPTYAVIGEEFIVKGIAEGKPTNVGYYVFGNNYFDAKMDVTVEDDNTFEISIKPADKKMEAGQYFLVIQHPMYNNKFNVGPNQDTTTKVWSLYLNKANAYTTVMDDAHKLLTVDMRQTTNAAYALCRAIDGDEDIDDMYVKRSFNVVDKSSIINAIPNQVAQGDALVVSGTARGYKNAAVAVTVSTGGAFDAVSKNDSGNATGSFAEVTTVAADGSWSVSFDTANIPVGEYKVTVKVGDASTSEGKDLKVVQGTTPKPTQTGAEPTTAPTTAPTQTPASPGFGILAALAGLGAVAVLLLRRQ